MQRALIALIVTVSLLPAAGQLLPHGWAILLSLQGGLMFAGTPWLARRLAALPAPQLVLAWGLWSVPIWTALGLLSRAGLAARFYLFEGLGWSIVIGSTALAVWGTGVLIYSSWSALSREGARTLAAGAIINGVLALWVVAFIATASEVDFSFRAPVGLDLDDVPVNLQAWAGRQPYMPARVEYEPAPAAAGRATGLSELFARVSESVVVVGDEAGFGSAFLVSSDGLAITAYHVIDSGGPFFARFPDGGESPVRVIRGNPKADVALLQLDCPAGCPALALAARRPRPGDPVIVIGTPWTEALSQSVSFGVVSGVRELSGVTLVQTDAAVNGGNSGGPIINARTGNVVGIVSWQISDPRVDGLAFGIGIDSALEALGLRL